jgi:glutamate dehydrogenase/leucine dehydrogenase
MPAVRIQKLERTNAFIVFDLAEATQNIGITRLAPKILVDGATLLARSTTYLLATFEWQMGGASAGINAKPADRGTALAAFVEEVEPLVREGTFRTEPGKGVSEEDFAALLAADPRPGAGAGMGRDLIGTSAATAAEKTLGGLDGRTVAIEGLDRSTVGVVTAMAEGGAQIVAVSTTKGTVVHDTGFDASVLASLVAEHGVDAVDHLDAEVLPAAAVFADEVDVFCVGSKTGIVDHDVATSIKAPLVVPIAPLPITAKALAVLRRAERIVLPDFVTIAGPTLAWLADEGTSVDDLRTLVSEAVEVVLDEVLDHEDGPLLAACYRAEAFLRTWQDDLPFGRPLA